MLLFLTGSEHESGGSEEEEGVRSGTGTVCLCLTFHRKEILQKFFRRGAKRRGAFLKEEGYGRWGRP